MVYKPTYNWGAHPVVSKWLNLANLLEGNQFESPIFPTWSKIYPSGYDWQFAMERSTIFKKGKPSISMVHLYHGELLNNQRVGGPVS